MPLYTLLNKKTQTIETVIMSYSDMMTITDSIQGTHEYVPAPLNLVSGHGTITGKIDSGFNDVLHRIKSANKGSTIQTK
jgi:hypothetical protein